jgi:prepilin-type N-terminal cleavage/methylation domain-containing protein
MERFTKKLMRALRGGQKGFTLIELLIVVAILGILAAVIIPNVSGFMVTGRLNAKNTEVENVKTAALAYYAEYGTWPANTRTDNFSNFYAGSLDVEYTFDDDYGWVLNASPYTTNGIAFQTGSTGSTGSHGKWTRWTGTGG